VDRREARQHARIRAGYDRTVADAWRKKVEEVEDQRNALRSEVDKLYDPHRMIIAVPSDAKSLPAALADKKPLGNAVAYTCRGMTCSPPVRTLGELVRSLRP